MKDSKLYKVLRPILKCFTALFLRPNIIGKENISKEEGIILAGNHTHILDCLLLMSSTKRSVHFLAKKELWNGPKKVIFGNMGLIPVDRKKKNPEALIKAKECLNDNKIICIFPEGTTEKGRGLLPFKMGAVKMARDTNTKIVPFVISGSYKIFNRNLKIQFGIPIKVENDDLEEENNKLRNVIKQMMKDGEVNE